MSSKDFFVNRYRQLGWKYTSVELNQAIRINSMNIERIDVKRRLESRGIQLEKIPFLEAGYWITKSDFSIGATTEYLLGLYSLQEAAAQIPATLFSELKDKIVLDASAAPGGKTVQLADIMRNTGAIIALDVEKRRLSALSNHLERCHVSNTIAYHLDARQVRRLNLKFDRILLDMPCSGNFATDKEWFNRRTIEDVLNNAKLQREIMIEAKKTLKEDGEIVYATCSLEPEEDELNIDWAIKNLGLQTQNIDCYGEKGLTDVFGKKLDASIQNCRRIWPQETQGFFVCKLKKRTNLR
ncbi:MAG TPA: NOL1/NOP2/sun family putative RNA methylase [Candidatus Acidoferrum sp.]|nr:NOL1/NOP2/sun family putative RNA methylase [Candidatus Acidoferrum sp.]